MAFCIGIALCQRQETSAFWGFACGTTLPYRALAMSKTALAALRSLGNSLMVEQRTLTPLVLVRIQVPQPTTLIQIELFDVGANSAVLSVG